MNEIIIDYIISLLKYNKTFMKLMKIEISNEKDKILQDDYDLLNKSILFMKDLKNEKL